MRISGSRSSQFLSSLLFLAPMVGEDVRIEITDELISQPLVTTTLEVMRQAGIVIDVTDDLLSFQIAGGQSYRPGEYRVNGDWPSSAAILAAGALTCSGIIVERLFEDGQGERAVLDWLRETGVDVSWDGERVELRGHDGLRGVDFDGGYEGGHEAQTYHDHRVAQMQALMGLRSLDGAVVLDAETVGKSYPAFFNDLIGLGAQIDIESDR